MNKKYLIITSNELICFFLIPRFLQNNQISLITNETFATPLQYLYVQRLDLYIRENRGSLELGQLDHPR